jgi:hypothetical protein
MIAEQSLFDTLPGLTPEPAPVAPSAFVTESRAAQLFLNAAQTHRPGKVRTVRISFHPFRTTLYTYKIGRLGNAHVKFHMAFRRAPELAVAQACAIMLSRGGGRRTNCERDAYDTFVRAMPPTDFELPGARRGRKLALSKPGRVHSLDESFDRVNRRYFKSQLAKPELCWSPVRARRLLGSYHERKDRLIISQLFDSPRIPAQVLDFLMFHELLHKFLGVGRRGDGRRSVHGREFREIERQFENYDQVQQFLKKL